MSVFVEKTLAEQGFGACWARYVAPLVEAGVARRRRRTMFASLITGMAVGLGGVALLLQAQVPDAGFLAQPLNRALVLALAALAVIGEMLDLPRIPVWVFASAAGYALRAAAIQWKLALPAYRDRDSETEPGEA